MLNQSVHRTGQVNEPPSTDPPPPACRQYAGPSPMTTLRSAYQHLYFMARETKTRQVTSPARDHTAKTGGTRKGVRTPDFQVNAVLVTKDHIL